MENTKKKGIRLNDLKDKILGKEGTSKRTDYEQNLALEMLGEQLKELRIKKNLTQEALAQQAGIQKVQISRLEKGTDTIAIGTIQKVANVLQSDLQITLLQKNALRLDSTLPKF